MKKRIQLLFALASVLPLAMTAQNSQTLTINQAVQMGMSNSKVLRMDTLKLAQARIKQSQVNDAALPNVNVSAGYTRLSDITPLQFQFPGNPEPVTLYPNIPNQYILHASVGENIFTGWKLKYSIESYGYLTKASELDVAKDEGEVRFNIMAAYLSFVKLRLSQQIVDENIHVAQQRVDEVTSMRERGMATDNDVLKAQLYQSNLLLSKSDMENSVAVSQYNLCILLGLPETTMIQADTTGLFAAIALQTESSYEQLAISNRTELQAAGARNQASMSNVKVAQSVYYPTVGVFADYAYDRPNQRIFPPSDEFNATWDAGVRLTWNLTGLYAGKHNIADAKMQVMQSQLQTDMLTDNIRMEVFQNYSAVVTAQNKLTTLDLAVKQSEENNRQVKAKYDQQAALMSDVLDADASLLQSRVNLVLQRAEVQLAYNRLLKSTGTLK